MRAVIPCFVFRLASFVPAQRRRRRLLLSARPMRGLPSLGALFVLGSAALVACHASTADAPAPGAESRGVTPQPEATPVSPSKEVAPASEPASEGRAALDTIAGVLEREGLLVSDELTAKGLADLEQDVTAGLASVAERRTQLDPKAPQYRKAAALFNAMEAQLRAQLADLRDGLFLTVDGRFGGRQFGLQQENPSWVFVQMSPKESRLGKAVVIFCLDERRHADLREARRLRRLATRESRQG